MAIKIKGVTDIPYRFYYLIGRNHARKSILVYNPKSGHAESPYINRIQELFLATCNQYCREKREALALLLERHAMFIQELDRLNELDADGYDSSLRDEQKYRIEAEINSIGIRIQYELESVEMEISELQHKVNSLLIAYCGGCVSEKDKACSGDEIPMTPVGLAHQMRTRMQTEVEVIVG